MFLELVRSTPATEQIRVTCTTCTGQWKFTLQHWIRVKNIFCAIVTQTQSHSLCQSTRFAYLSLPNPISSVTNVECQKSWPKASRRRPLRASSEAPSPTLLLANILFIFTSAYVFDSTYHTIVLAYQFYEVQLWPTFSSSQFGWHRTEDWWYYDLGTRHWLQEASSPSY